MPIRLGYLLIDGFALMSYAPVIEPFRAANRLSGVEHYSWRHFSVAGGDVRASAGVSLSVDAALTATEPLDILFVCAGGNPALFRDPATLQMLRRISRFGTILAGISGGPFILARAGLLDNYRCTIHWEHADTFAETFFAPQLENSLFVIDRDRITCAGGLAGLDLATVMIAEAQGALLARKVSDWYIQTEQRQAGGPQRSSPARLYHVTHKGLADALTAMAENIAEPLSRNELAEIAGISVRQLERLFASRMRTSIAKYYTMIRLNLAAKLITETAMPLAEIAIAAGFGSSSQFSRAFKQHYALTPSHYRHRIAP